MKKYFSLVKFSHTVFALPFAMIGYVMGCAEKGVYFDGRIFLLVLVCMVSARTAAMAFNRWADRKYDAQNPRTAVREIPSSEISSSSALWLIFLSCFVFVLSSYFINTTCFCLSPIALAVVLGYSYTKRFTALCHLVLGVGLALAPIGAFIAMTGHVNREIILLGCIVLFWVSGFDIIYALQDEEFDKQHRLHSIPSFLGKKNALLVSRLLHLMSALILIFMTLIFTHHYFFYIAVIIFVIALIFQHFQVKNNDLSKVNLAFFTTNGIASICFGVFAILDIILLKS